MIPSARFLIAFCLLTGLVHAQKPATLEPSAANSPREASVLRLAAKNQAERLEVLLSHGVNLDSPSLLLFLETGFPEAARRRGLPEGPEIKSNVVNAAIQELGFLQNPEATNLLLKIYRGQLPNGINNILGMDTEVLPLDARALAQRSYKNNLRFNALVALGYLNDSTPVLPIREQLLSETDNSYILEGSITLALLGDPKSLEILLERFSKTDEPRFHLAFEVIFHLTGRNYDVSEFASKSRKEKALQDFREWYSTEGASWVPERDAILRRRENGLILSTPPAGSLRGALRATKNFSDYDARYAGRTFLRNRAKSQVPELQIVSNDPAEELDIRTAAMEWFAATEPDDARSDLKKLQKNDENPEIRQKAQSLLLEIQKLKEAKP
jgi:hypothetical protein